MEIEMKKKNKDKQTRLHISFSYFIRYNFFNDLSWRGSRIGSGCDQQLNRRIVLTQIRLS